MKLLATTAAAFALFLGAASKAEAREYCDDGYRTTIVVTGRDCDGRPIYAERYLIRVRSTGEPLWGYRPASYRPDRCDDYRPVYRGRDYCEPRYERRGPPSPIELHREHREAVHRVIGGIFR
jgi:hypothetical protein